MRVDFQSPGPNGCVDEESSSFLSSVFATDVRTIRRQSRQEIGLIKPEDYAALQENTCFAEELGARVVKLKAPRVVDALTDFARREGITHVVFGQTSRSRWDILLHGSIINRFLDEVRDANVQVVPLESEKNGQSS